MPVRDHHQFHFNRAREYSCSSDQNCVPIFHTIRDPLVALTLCNFFNLRIASNYTRCSKKTDPLIGFCNNFGKCTPILILFPLLQQENYGTQNLSYFSHLTCMMLPLYLAKQTLMLYQCHSISVCFAR